MAERQKGSFFTTGLDRVVAYMPTLPRAIIQKALDKRLNRGRWRFWDFGSRASLDHAFLKHRTAARNTDSVTFVMELSHYFSDQLKKRCDALEIVPHLSALLDEIPLLVIPMQTFIAEAVRPSWPPRNRKLPYIVLSEGTINLLAFAAKAVILGIIRDQWMNHRNFSKQKQEVNSLFFKILGTQLLNPKDAVPLRSLLNNLEQLPQQEDIQVLLFSSTTLLHLFVVLHEIGHIKLNHLERHALRDTVKNDAIVIR
jgi:hypothetical protein